MPPLPFTYLFILHSYLFIYSIVFCFNFKVNVAAQNLFFNPACVVKSDATMQDLTGVYGCIYTSFL